MWRRSLHGRRWSMVRRDYSRIGIQPPSPVGPDTEYGSVIRVSNNVARLGRPRGPPKPRQLLSLPPFPGLPLPAKHASSNHNGNPPRVTAVMWLKYYFDDIDDDVIRSHFNKGLVQRECSNVGDSLVDKEGKMKPVMRKINLSEAMEKGDLVHVSVSIVESKISKRYDVIPSGTLHPNADEIAYLQRLVHYKDYCIILLNKPPKFPLKGHLPLHNSMDALAAAALSYKNEEGPKLVHRLDRETSGLVLMGRTKESIKCLELLFSEARKESPCEAWNKACEATYQRYWALVIGSPKEKEGVIDAPISKVLLNDGKTERVILAHKSGFDIKQRAITKYRVLGPMINGCSWLELCPLTNRKHQLRVHCAEALGTPIVGDYKYGWFVHKRWKQTKHVDIEPTSGEPYKMRRPSGLDVQKGSVMAKVPLLHLHSREFVLPNIAKFLQIYDTNAKPESLDDPSRASKHDLYRFVAPMPPHMKISWNLMSSYLI